MPIDDIFTLLDEGIAALRSGEYDQARGKFIRVLESAAESSPEYRQAARYMQHLGNNDNAPNFKLLLSIRQETEVERRIALLEEALDKKLVYALPLVNAPELKDLLAQLRSPATESEADALFVKGEHALNEHDYVSARDIFNDLAARAPASAEARQAKIYLRHLERDALRLLQEIARESEDANRRLKLLNEAIDDQGLEYALPLFNQEPLARLRAKASQQVRAWHEDLASNALMQGDQALASGQLEEAIRHYHRGLEFTEISAELEKEIREKLVHCQTRYDNESEVAETLSEVETAYEAGDYAGAQKLLQDIAALASETPRFLEISKKVQERLDTATRLHRTLEGAEAENNPWKAEKAYQEILAEAETINLTELVQQAQAGLTAAQEQQEVRAQEAQNWAEEGWQAEQRQAWNDAQEAYQEALRLDKHNAMAQQGLDRVDAQIQKLLEAEQLKAQGMAAAASNSWAEAEEKFQQAQNLLPDDLELKKLVDQAFEKARANRTEKATIGSGITPYETPTVMSDRFLEIEAEHIFTQPEFTAFLQSARRIFRREATFKLRRYLEPARNWINQGKFAQAITLYQEAHAKWTEYLKEETTQREGPLPALQQRLQILETYRDHLDAAQETWAPLIPQVEDATSEEADGNHREAVESWHSVLRGLDTAPAEARYVLGEHEGDDGVVDYAGVWRHAREHFATCTRHLAWEWEPQWREARWHAETLLQQGEVAAAENYIKEHYKNLEEFKPVAERYQAITGAPWPLAEYAEKLTHLHEQINRAIKATKALDEARESFESGRLQEAEGYYQEALKEIPDSTHANLGLEAVRQLRELEARQMQHQQAGDLAEEQAVLQQMVRRAPAWEQMRERLQEVQAALQRAAEVEGWRRSARLFKQRSDTANARKFAQQVLDVGFDEEMTQIITWATQAELALAQREQWNANGRAALQQGKFRQALGLAEKVLAQDQDPSNVDAQLLREDAQLAQKRFEQARDLTGGRLPDYDEAERLLLEIDTLTGGIRQGEWATLLQKIERWQKDNAQVRARLEKIKRAKERQQWYDVLRLAKRDRESEPQARGYFELAEQELRTAIEAAIHEQHWDVVRRHLQALHKAGIIDEDVHQWDLACERAEAFRQADDLLVNGLLEELEVCDATLERLAEELPYDRDIKGYRQRLQAKILWERGRRAMEPPADYALAVKELQDALRKRPGAEARKAIESLLEEAGINWTLEKVDKILSAGNENALNTAVGLLQKVRVKDDRIKTQIQKIERMRTQLREAHNLYDQDVVRAGQCLEEVLNLYPHFRPAETLLQQLVTDLRQQGQEAEAKNDLSEARSIYSDLRAIAPKEDNPLDEIEERLDREIRDLNFQMTQALGNPDLEITDAQALLDAVECIPAEERRTRRIFNGNLSRLRDRIEDIRTVDSYHEMARKRLEDAHQVGEEEYHRVQQSLDKIRAVQAIFGRRTVVRELQRSLNEHRNRRNQMVGWDGEYRAVLTKWQQPEAAVGADFIKPVQDFYDKGMQLLDSAIDFNRDLKKTDPENLYQLREDFSGGAVDPLEEKHNDLVKQRINFQSIAELLLEGIRRRDSANAKAEEALKLHDESTSVQDFENARHLLEEAINNYRFSEESLGQIKQIEPCSARASVLHQDAQQLLRKVTRSKEEVRARIPEISEKISRLNDYHRELRSEVEAGHWGSALEYCVDILEINPNDAEARRKKVEMKRRIEQAQEESSRQQKRLVTFIATGVVAMILFAVGWYFLFGPGKIDPTPTPLPGVTEPIETVGPSPTLEDISPSPTLETTEAPTPAIEIEYYDEPRLCTLRQTGVKTYSEPDLYSIRESLDRGLGQSVDAIAQTSDGRWLLLEIPRGKWIEADVVQCIEE